MSKARVIVHDGLSAEEARRAVLTLLALGVDAEAHPPHGADRHLAHGADRHLADGADRQLADGADRQLADGADRHLMPGAREPERPWSWHVSVAEEDVGSALPVLAEGFEADAIPPPPARRSVLLSEAASGIWTWPNAAGSFVVAAICVAVHLAVHEGSGPSGQRAMLDAGAVAPWLVASGEWWRLVTAVFLHFDVRHLVSNMSALMVLGPPLAAAIGHVRWFALYVATGILGNFASQVFGSEGAIKAGASGAICGLLGALAGVAIATMAAAENSRERRPAWQTLGALVALFGMMVGFEPGRDHYAHVGGLVAGVVLGRLSGARIDTARIEASGTEAEGSPS